MGQMVWHQDDISNMLASLAQAPVEPGRYNHGWLDALTLAAKSFGIEWRRPVVVVEALVLDVTATEVIR